MAYFHQLARAPKSQQGIILIAVLVILAALTLLVMSALSTSALEFQMSHNSTVQLQAFLNAESELNRAAEQIKQGDFKTQPGAYKIDQLAKKICPATFCFRVQAQGQTKQTKITLFAQYDLSINPATKRAILKRVVWGTEAG